MRAVKKARAALWVPCPKRSHREAAKYAAAPPTVTANSFFGNSADKEGARKAAGTRKAAGKAKFP
jgi:hypothetical protein